METGLSICITAYKAKEYIKECLDSVFRQTWAEKNRYEVIVGIDGCKETLEYLKTIIFCYKDKPLRILMMNENKGTYITTNTIMKDAKYDWLMRFDSDDIMPETFIETLFECKGKERLVTFARQNFGINNEFSAKAHGPILIKKECFTEYGGYQPWVCGADTELLLRVGQNEKIGNCDNAVFLRRLHPNSLYTDERTNPNSDLRKRHRSYCNEITPTIKTIEMITNGFKEIKCYIPKVIVSLTSYGKRIKTINKIIDSILMGKLPPDKIVLTLYKDDVRYLTNDLYSYIKNNNIDLLICDSDLGAHKKYYYVMKKYKKDIIITIDDDIVYPDDLVETVVNSYKKFPLYISARRAREIKNK